MAKYHVKKSGEIGTCRAQEGNCPLTQAGAMHFSDMESAVQYVEVLAQKEAGSTFGEGLKKVPSTSEVNGEELSPQKKLFPTVPTFQELSRARRTPACYSKSWGEGRYLGAYLEEGEYFAYRGEVLQLKRATWDGALLQTNFTAFDAQGEEVNFTVTEDEEKEVGFWPRGGEGLSEEEELEVSGANGVIIRGKAGNFMLIEAPSGITTLDENKLAELRDDYWDRRYSYGLVYRTDLWQPQEGNEVYVAKYGDESVIPAQGAQAVQLDKVPPYVAEAFTDWEFSQDDFASAEQEGHGRTLFTEEDTLGRA